MMNRPMPWVALLLAVVASACTTGQPCEPRAAASPQTSSDCHFRNLPNPDALPTQSGWKIWSRFFTATKQGTVPVDPIPLRRLDRAQLEALDPAANHLIRLGHSSQLLKLRGRFWLIDPVFSQRASPLQWLGPKRFHAPPLALDQLPPIEGLILSHDHYDHLDTATIEALRDRVQRYFVPLGVGARLRDMGVASERIEEFDWWQRSRHGEVELVAAPAQHFSGRGLWDRDRTLWASWVIVSGSQRLFYSGDSGYFGGFKQIGQRLGGFDIALLENGAYDTYWPSVHMTPEQTIQAFKDLNARLLYVVHNSTFDLAFHTWRDPLDRVSDLALREGLPLATPEIGEVLTLGRPRDNVLWWKPLR